MKLISQTHQEVVLKKTTHAELKINLNQTKDSVDSTNSWNKLKLWSSIDNQSSHSVGRRENRRYAQESDVNADPDMFDSIHENQTPQIISTQTTSLGNTNAAFLASGSTLAATVEINRNTVQNTKNPHNASEHKVFKDFLSQQDIEHNTHH